MSLAYGYHTVTENNISTTIHGSVPSSICTKAYYSAVAKDKRAYCLQFLSKLHKPFLYIDAFCSSGVMGILVKKTFVNAKVYSNDKYVAPGLILHNYLQNGLIPDTITRSDVVDLNLASLNANYNTDLIVLDLDPFGSTLPYIPFLNMKYVDYLILTHTDLINLCSRRGANTYFSKFGLYIPFSAIRLELAILAVTTIIVDITKIRFTLVDFYTKTKYITLYLKQDLEHSTIKPQYYWLCYCGAVYNCFITCYVCKRSVMYVGPLCLLHSVYNTYGLGGFNLLEYAKLRKCSIRNKTFESIMQQYNISFTKYVDSGVYKVNAPILTVCKLLDTTHNTAKIKL